MPKGRCFLGDKMLGIILEYYKVSAGWSMSIYYHCVVEFNSGTMSQTMECGCMCGVYIFSVQCAWYDVHMGDMYICMVCVFFLRLWLWCVDLCL